MFLFLVILTMNLHLVVPALFWPDRSQSEIYHDLPLPALQTILAKSQSNEEPGHQLEAWLCRLFGVDKQQDWPVAPIMLQLDGEGIDIGEAYWLRADPVHLRIENNHILLADNQILNISLKEAQAFTTFINAQLAKDGLMLLPLHADRWYVRVHPSPELNTHLLSEVVGRNINHLLPGGRDGVAWNNRINEIQMLLYDSPLNQAREARGELAINSLWIWGGGMRPESMLAPYPEIWSNHPFTQALSKASGAVGCNLPANAGEWLGEARSSEQMIVLDHLQKYACYKDAYAWRNDLVKLEQEWFVPLLQALKAKQIKRLELTAIDEHAVRRFTLTPNSLWKFWATGQPLQSYA